MSQRSTFLLVGVVCCMSALVVAAFLSGHSNDVLDSQREVTRVPLPPSTVLGTATPGLQAAALPSQIPPVAAVAAAADGVLKTHVWQVAEDTVSWPRDPRLQAWPLDLDLAVLQQKRKGDRLLLALPDNRQLETRVVRVQQQLSGAVSWVLSHRANGQEYFQTFTVSDKSLFGSLESPFGQFRVEGDPTAGTAYMISSADFQQQRDYERDGVVPPSF